MHCVLTLSDVLTRDRPVATVVESLLRGSMRISAPGDCNQAFRQSSGALAVQIGLVTVANGGGNRTSFPLRLVINFNIGGCVWLVRPDANRRAIAFEDSFLATLNCAALCR